MDAIARRTGNRKIPSPRKKPGRQPRASSAEPRGSWKTRADAQVPRAAQVCGEGGWPGGRRAPADGCGGPRDRGWALPRQACRSALLPEKGWRLRTPPDASRARCGPSPRVGTADQPLPSRACLQSRREVEGRAEIQELPPPGLCSASARGPGLGRGGQTETPSQCARSALLEPGRPRPLGRGAVPRGPEHPAGAIRGERPWPDATGGERWSHQRLDRTGVRGGGVHTGRRARSAPDPSRFSSRASRVSHRHARSRRASGLAAAGQGAPSLPRGEASAPSVS